jgi:hypothetical protein
LIHFVFAAARPPLLADNIPDEDALEMEKKLMGKGGAVMGAPAFGTHAIANHPTKQARCRLSPRWWSHILNCSFTRHDQ